MMFHGRVEIRALELVHLVLPQRDISRGQLLQAGPILFATLDAVLLPFVKSIDRDEDEGTAHAGLRRRKSCPLSDLLLQQRFERSLPGFASGAGMLWARRKSLSAALAFHSRSSNATLR